MQTNVLPGETPEQIKNRLQNDCDSAEETTYYKPLTEEDINLRNEVVLKNTMQLYKLADELKEIKDGYKNKMEPLHNENKRYCHEVETGHEKVSGTVFHFFDYDARTCSTLNELGEVVSTRRLTPDELKDNRKLAIVK